jgi:uncharacterized protein YbdZ (MbtH family)
MFTVVVSEKEQYSIGRVILKFPSGGERRISPEQMICKLIFM